MPGTRVAEGERVTLRPVEREDLTFTQRAATDPAIRYPLGSVVRSRRNWMRRSRTGTTLTCSSASTALNRGRAPTPPRETPPATPPSNRERPARSAR